MDPFTRELLEQLFPFHVKLAADGTVERTGCSLAKVLPEVAGRGFLDVFEVVRPAVRDLAGIRANVGALVLLSIRGTPLAMRGQFVTLPDGGMIFAGSPRIVDQSSVWAWPVGVLDFAPHDVEALRTDHAHRRLGFADGEVNDWLVEAGLEPGDPATLPGNRLTVALWQARRPG